MQIDGASAPSAIHTGTIPSGLARFIGRAPNAFLPAVPSRYWMSRCELTARVISLGANRESTITIIVDEHDRVVAISQVISL